MPQVEKAEPNNRKRSAPMLAIIGVGVLVLVGIAYEGWYYLGPPSPATTVAAADALDAQGKYNQAEAKLDQAYPRAWRAADKELIISRQAATNVDMGNKEAALNYFQHLNTLEPHQFGTLESLGQLADDLGNKPVAIAAYTEALSIRKTQLSHIYAQSEVDQLTSRLDELRQ